MRAVVYHQYGTVDELQFKELPIPVPKDDEVLIKLHATSLNGSDWETLTGKPLYARIWGLFKPRLPILGSDIAGRVEAVGKNVKRFEPGDEVFGDILWYKGGFAEYAVAPEDALSIKPASMSFEQAAAIPQAAFVALQALRDSGEIAPGKKVLINGAGGGMGTFAVQIAKWYGTEVTAVDGEEKLDVLKSIGADHVIDYTREDYTKTGQQYDLILDVVARRSVFSYRRALSPDGIFIFVGGSMFALLQVYFLGAILSKIGNKKIGGNSWEQNRKEDFALLEELFASGKVVPVIDRTYSLDEVPAALQYIGEKRAKGKIVITIQ